MWTDTQLIEAVDASSQLTIATKTFGIPPSSLQDHFNGRTVQRKKRRQGVLKKDEEATLVQLILQMQDHAHPISILELKSKVTKIIQEHLTSFKDGILGCGWLGWFVIVILS